MSPSIVLAPESRHLLERQIITQAPLRERWANFPGSTFYVAATSFGIGLNFLAAWQQWEASAAADKQLHFVAVESQALSRSDLEQGLTLWPELADFSQALLDVYPQRPTGGFHQFVFAGRRVTLTLIVADATAGLKQLLMSDHPLYRKPFHPGMDAWLLDASAAVNEPAALFDVIAALSREHATLIVAKGVRPETVLPKTISDMEQGLRRAGFTPAEETDRNETGRMLVATYTSIGGMGIGAPKASDFNPDTRHSPYPTPWQVLPLPEDTAEPEAVVIGAGLAGSHSARALAERGWRVTVLEAAESVASGASGNAQGIVYGKLSNDSDGLASFNLASLLYAQRFYKDYWQRDPSIGEQCGLLQLAFNKKELAIRDKLQASFAGADDFLRFVSPQQASEIAGIALESPGMFFPQLGWLKPAQLCRELLDHPNIIVQCNSPVAALKESGSGWELRDGAGQVIATAPRLVIANAHHALGFSQTEHLPLKPIRGQVSEFPGERFPLKTVLCGEGYIAPTDKGDGGRQSFGASYTLHEQRPEVLLEDHRQNLASLSTSLPGLAPALEEIDPRVLTGRTAFRCTTLDYLPLLGPVPDYHQFIQDFELLGKNAKAGIPRAGPYLRGLYINVGHGSRGLAYTALAAEMLAAQMNRDPLPVTRGLATALNPARFIIRDLIRKRLKP